MITQKEMGILISKLIKIKLTLFTWNFVILFFPFSCFENIIFLLIAWGKQRVGLVYKWGEQKRSYEFHILRALIEVSSINYVAVKLKFII